MFSSTARVWAGLCETGRCKYCRRAILWLTRDDAKRLPFNAGFTVRETVVHPTIGAEFHLVAYSDLHRCDAGRLARATVQAKQAPRRRARVF